MRTTDYIKKYNLKEGLILQDKNLFLQDFYLDFQSNIEIQIETISEFTEINFWDTVSKFRMKFESIFNKSPMSWPEEIWDDFNDNYVPIVLFDFFPSIKDDIMEIKKMEYVDLYIYIFETLELGKLISKNKYIHISKPFAGNQYSKKYTNSPSEYFLEDIINICKKLLEINLFYVELVSCEIFLDWSENKLKSVKNINRKKEDERRSKYSNNNEQDFFNFFWYFNFKKKMEDELKKSIKLQFLSHFKVLGIEPTKNENTIKSVYKEMAKKYHPDKIGNSKENHERMVEINEAKTKCLLYCKGGD